MESGEPGKSSTANGPSPERTGGRSLTVQVLSEQTCARSEAQAQGAGQMLAIQVCAEQHRRD